MATEKPLLKHAIVFGARMDLREALRDSLRRVGVDQVDAAVQTESALDMLAKDPRALLVIDYDLGKPVVIKVLETIRKDYRIETRPIILIAKAATPELVALAYEYHITRIHSGEISKNNIRSLIEEIAKDEIVNAPLRGILAAVTEKREAGDWDGAGRVLEEIYRRIPNNPAIATELAENKIHDNDWAGAAALLEPQTRAQPPYVRGLHLLGRCYMKLGQYEAASQAFGQAKVMNPFNIDRLLVLGQALLFSNKTAEAADVFREVETLDPGNKQAKKGRSQAMLLEGDVDEALTLLKDLKQPRELAAVFNSAAIIAMRNGEFEKGMGLYDSAFAAITKDIPTRARLFFNKGVGFRRWQKDEQAVVCFGEAIKCDGTYQKAKENYVRLSRKLRMSIPAEIAKLLGPELATPRPAVLKPAGEIQVEEMNELQDLDEHMDQEGVTIGFGGEGGNFDVDFNDELDEDDTLSLF